ncbi:MAG: heparinase II/III family protein, partial [Verrucomicrobiota bacterium]
MRSFFLLSLISLLIAAPGRSELGSEPVSVSVSTGETRSHPIASLPEGPFEIIASIDPSTREGGDLQALACLQLGWPNSTAAVLRSEEPLVYGFEVREGNGIGFWESWLGDTNATHNDPAPLPPGWADQTKYQLPNRFAPRDKPYQVRIVGIPGKRGTTLRIFFEHFDRPLEEHQFPGQLSGSSVVAISSLGGIEPNKNTSSFTVSISPLSEEEAAGDPTPRETVLRAIDFSRPEMQSVAASIREGDLDEAGRLFLRHLRTRNEPKGPDWEEVEDVVLHPDYREIARANLAGSYGNSGWFGDFAPQWTDANGETHRRVHPDGTINWSRENGHLNRHFHWVALAKTWEETGDSRYA